MQKGLHQIKEEKQFLPSFYKLLKFFIKIITFYMQVTKEGYKNITL